MSSTDGISFTGISLLSGVRQTWQGVAGGAAGGVAAALTTPLDVVKTRLQLAGVGSPTRYLSVNAVRPSRRAAAAVDTPGCACACGLWPCGALAAQRNGCACRSHLFCARNPAISISVQKQQCAGLRSGPI